MFMKIAVTYDNGNIFQHFGKTENFKIYTVEDGQILSSEVIGTGGIGHEALAGLLADLGADTVICGGLGGGGVGLGGCGGCGGRGGLTGPGPPTGGLP